MVCCRCLSNPISRTLSVEEFKSISDFFITDEDLCGRVITLSVLGRQFVGCAVCLEHTKYERNCLIFNAVFVLKSTTDPKPFYDVVKKLSRLLETLERENELFSDPAKKATLSSIMPRVFEGLRDCNECSVYDHELDTEINLKIFHQRKFPRQIKQHEVPVLIQDVSAFRVHWDLALQQILPFIDGVNCIKKIAFLSNVDIEIVMECLRQLLFYELIVLQDIFQFSNIYCVTPRIHALASAPEMQTACMNYVVSNHQQASITVRSVFCLYSQLRRGLRIKQLCESSALLKSGVVDIRRLITFGIANGLIRRVHVYPMLINNDKSSLSHSVIRDRYDLLNQMIEANCCLDEICCRLGASLPEIEGRISAIHNCITIMR